MVHVDTAQAASLIVIDAPRVKMGSYTDRLREIKEGLQRIRHAGVLRIYDVGTLPDGRPYFVRELLDGVTLREHVTREPLSTEAAIRILAEIADVLAAAHARGVTHRALDLDHVLIGSEPRVKLIDWGITQAIADEASRELFVPVTHRTDNDVYAFGILAHQLVARAPHKLEELWVSMIGEDANARPSIATIARRLRRYRPHQRAVPSYRHAVYALLCAAPLLLLFTGDDEQQSIQPLRMPFATPQVAAPVPPRVEAPLPVETPAVIATTTVQQPTAPPPKATQSAKRERQVLAQYQRVGHQLLTLQQRFGTEKTAALWSRFRSIRIEAISESRSARRRAARVLDELEAGARTLEE